MLSSIASGLALGLHTSIGFGNNGPQSDPDLEGDFGGIVAMPMYWIQKIVKLVPRYQYEGSDNPKGIRLNSRYARLAETRDSSVDLNSVGETIITACTPD